MEYNTFSGFNSVALLYFISCDSILFKDNIINVDISGIYYDISLMICHFEKAPLYYTKVSSRTIDNKFQHEQCRCGIT